MDPGSIPSLALSLAPLASWISLILDPPLPMTEPMREFGMINLMVTALLPGIEGTSNGSSLIRRTIKPNALKKKKLHLSFSSPPLTQWECLNIPWRQRPARH